MIRAILYDPGTGKSTQGGIELIERWQAGAGGEKRPLIWVDFSGEDKLEEARIMQSVFGLHENAVEDAQRDRHPPKYERFQHFTFLLLKGLGQHHDDFGTIQIAFFLADEFLVTRHLERSVSLDKLWKAVEEQPEMFREGPARLFTFATRTIVDRYLRVLLELEQRLEELEVEIEEHPSDVVLGELSGYKSELKRVRRIFAYHDRIFSELKQHTAERFSGDLVHDLNDVCDRMERAASLSSLYHDLAADLMESYISIASHRLNTIMKVLTIITAIFVPLSFIAGVYGMNFEYMPELAIRNAYFVVLGVMAGVVALLLYIFKRNRWL